MSGVGRRRGGVGRRPRRSGRAVGGSGGSLGAEVVGHAAVAGQRPRPGEQLAEPPHLDVAAGQHDRDALAVADTGSRPARTAREGRGPGRLEDLLEPLERRSASPARIVASSIRTIVVEVAPDHRQRPGAGERRAEAVGDARRLDRHDLAARERLGHRIGTDRLDAVDPGRRPPALDRRGDPADEAAATDADHDDVDVRAGPRRAPARPSRGRR